MVRVSYLPLWLFYSPCKIRKSFHYSVVNTVDTPKSCVSLCFLHSWEINEPKTILCPYKLGLGKSPFGGVTWVCVWRENDNRLFAWMTWYVCWYLRIHVQNANIIPEIIQEEDLGTPGGSELWLGEGNTGTSTGTTCERGIYLMNSWPVSSIEPRSQEIILNFLVSFLLSLVGTS